MRIIALSTNINEQMTMKKKLFLILFLSTLFFQYASAQVFYVDAQNGLDDYPGTQAKPFQTLSRAVAFTNSLTGLGTIHIKIMPGIYTLEGKLALNPIRMLQDTSRYILEAAILPDDQSWSPDKMPVIQSISPNNSETFFPHATGLLVAAPHVTLRGLKFLGNAHPSVDYYYPIAKEDQNLPDLEVVQCHFIGDKEAAKIQGGIWAHGPKNKVSHCVFYTCRNAVLFFNNAEGFSIQNSIVYGSYESAFWFGPEDYTFTFSNNIIIHNHNFLVTQGSDSKYSSAFANSIIANNEGYVGYWSREQQGIVPIERPNIQEQNIQKSGKFKLLKNNAVKLDKLHLHLSPDSDGYDLNAGIFQNR